jgi:archaellum biogenesis protein FlaJ (TadC family)
MMSDSDQIKLLRVAGYAALTSQDKSLKYEFVVKNIEERIANSDKAKEDAIKKVAKLIKDAGFTMETAMNYFDDDNSGWISRDEFNEGFKRMKVTLNEALLKNLFVILDANGDN